MFSGWYFKFEITFFVFMFFTVSVMAQIRVQDDTVKTPNVGNIPTIDGQSNDTCWGNVSWQTINQVWMPYEASIEADDYTGQYKVVWSSTGNVLYFLVEITDDVFVDGYEFPGGGYYNYDIVEVFIDEDKSGGMHRIDQGGENAENAFSYHIVVDAPADGEVNNDFFVCDLAGFWQIVNYADHFPALAMRKDGNKYTWEFSLKVYDDTYDDSNPEDSRITLTEDKIIGLSLAYCDNDEPDGIRDNFFGSVEVAREDSNSHWENADGFGTIKLIGESTGIQDDIVNSGISFLNYPNPFGNKTIIEFELPKVSKVTIDVLNVVGQPVDTVIEARFQRGRHRVQWIPEEIPSGIYFCRMQTSSFVDIRKLLIIK